MYLICFESHYSPDVFAYNYTELETAQLDNKP